MNRGIHVLLSALVVLTSQAGDGGCEAAGIPGYACHVETSGPEVADGRVVSRVWNWCETGLEPQEQTFITWIESRRNRSDEWDVASRKSGVSHVVPDSKGKRYRLRDGRCQADIEYGVAWRAYGTDRNGVAFDTGTMRRRSGTTGLC